MTARKASAFMCALHMTIAISVIWALTARQAFSGGRYPRSTIERLLQNALHHAREQPEDCRAKLTLGKLYSFGFAIQGNALGLQQSRHASHGTNVVFPSLSAALRTQSDNSALGFYSMPNGEWMPTAAERLLYARESLYWLLAAKSCDANSVSVELALGFAFDVTAHVSSLGEVASGYISRSITPDLPSFEQWRAVESRLATVPHSGSLAVPIDRAEEWCHQYLTAIVLLQSDSREHISRAAVSTLREVWLALAAQHYMQSLRLAVSQVQRGAVEENSEAPYSVMAQEAVDRLSGILSRMKGLESQTQTEVLLSARALASAVLGGAAGDLEQQSRVLKSPIVFRLGASTIQEAIGDGWTACFDMDADGARERWTWPRPGTCFLIWRVDAANELTGQDLLGEASWGLFPSNGYVALSLLDNDRDGYLFEEELRGLGVWCDINCDGAAELEELIDLQEFGIVAINCRPTGSSGDHLQCADGLLLSTGHYEATYDWYSERVGY